MEDPALNGMSWTYNEHDRLESQTDLGGVETEFTYDLANQVTSELTSEGYYRSHTYYANGWLQQTFDGGGDFPGIGRAYGGSTVDYIYDASGAVIRERHRVAYNYYQTGIPSNFYTEYFTLQDTHSRYDELGRLSQVNDLHHDTEYGYDIVSNRRFSRSEVRDLDRDLQTREYWYDYDRADRVTGSFYATLSSNGQILNDADGFRMVYDNTGNRVLETHYTEKDNLALDGRTVAQALMLEVGAPTNEDTTEDVKLRYSYDAENRLTTTRNALTSFFVSSRGYDSRGRVSFYSGDGKTNTYTYDADDRIQTQVQGGFTSTYAYFAHGALSSITQTGGGQPTVTFNYIYDPRETYREVQVTANTAGNNTTNRSTSFYDYRGNRIAVSFNDGTSQYREFTYNLNGQISQSTSRESVGGQLESVTTLHHYAGQASLGSSGQEVKNNALVDTADFLYNHSPINDSYPANAPSGYVVQAGDTLQSVALQLYGDAGLWYLIADANGLSGSETLTEGTTLQIPNKIANVRNAADTFTPFNPGEIIGDTRPEAPPPPPPPSSSKKCGGLLSIIVVVVAIVVTVYTAGAAASAFGAASSGFSTGGAVLTGGSVAAAGGGTLSAGATIASAAIGGAVGSVASQAVAIGLGVQDGFSFGQVASSAIGSAIGSGLGSLARGSEAFSFLNKPVARAVAQNALNQGVNVAVGLQDRFSWASVAASAVSSAIFDSKPVQGLAAGNQGVRSVGKFSFGNLARETATSFGRGLTQRAVTVALEGGGKISVEDIAADAFGNALGNSIVGHYQQKEFDQAVENLSPRGREHYEGVLASGRSTPQQALRDAREIESIFGPEARSRSTGPIASSIDEAALRADIEADFARAGGLEGVALPELNIAPETKAAVMDVAGINNQPAGRSGIPFPTLDPGRIQFPALDPANLPLNGDLSGSIGQSNSGLSLFSDPNVAVSNFLGETLLPNLMEYGRLGGSPTFMGTVTGIAKGLANVPLNIAEQQPIFSLGETYDLTQGDGGFPRVSLAFDFRPDERLGGAIADIAQFIPAAGLLGTVGKAEGIFSRVASVSVPGKIGVPVARSANPLSPVQAVDAYGNEIMYRTMSEKQFRIFEETGRIPSTGETSISPVLSYSSKYKGTTVKIAVEPGTSLKLQEIGIAANPPAARELPRLSTRTGAWNQTNARFKVEGGQMTTQLGRGRALELFNDRIVDFSRVE